MTPRGGNVIGVPELAAQIRASRELKPVIAIANPLAASAAYWISAQASSLSVTPSGSVGSIGVFAVHEDLSRAVEGQGRKVSLISAGKYKLEGNPFEPLSEEARAAIQERIDSAYGWFVGDVAKGRGVSEAAVRSGFGEGRMVFADQALDERMVDRTETLDEVVARVQSNPTSKSKAFAAAAGVASAQPGGVAGQEPANVAALLNLVEAEN